MNEAVDRELHELWRRIMDTGEYRPLIYCTDFAWKLGLLTDQERELWFLRAEKKCPGHDDGGGRSWCAYCGDVHCEVEE